MRRQKIFWRVYFPNVVIALLGLIVVSLYAFFLIKTFHRDQLVKDLRSRAVLAGAIVMDEGGLKPAGEVDALCDEYGERTSTRITVILPSGVVIGDSDRDPAVMDNHATRPEIITAYKGEEGISDRFSDTVQKNMMYLALPLHSEGRIAGVMRVSLPLNSIEQTLSDVTHQILLSSIAVVLASILAGLFVSRGISRPLERMKKSILDYTARGTGVRIEAPDTEEMAAVAEAVNSMIEELDLRMGAITRKNREQSAVLSSMQEGLLAIDNEEVIIQINDALLDILGAKLCDVKDQSLQQAIRNADLQSFATETLRRQENMESDISMNLGSDRRSFQANGTPLFDEDDKRIGALIVLNDVTRIKKLENMRRDFVANVSHELKTPITSIKGFVETLLDDPDISKKDLSGFLDIIFRQTNRLNAIIDDILVLSRLEFDAESKSVELTPHKIAGILKNAVDICRERAQAKNSSVMINCEREIMGMINPNLMEQAVANLLDNAIKYSGEGKHIQLRAQTADNWLEISVADDGPGIHASHLSRLFERFYRIDKARSNDLGGTGLGLAIVKHIVIAHRGVIDVDSEVGRGSTFIIRIPSA